MSGEEDRGHLHLLDHAVEGASGDGIHSRGWLIQEEHPRAKNNRLRAAQLAFVAAAEILSKRVLERCQVEVLGNEAFDDFAALTVDTLEGSNEVETLIDCHVFPHEVLLVADTEELAELGEGQLVDFMTHKLTVTGSNLVLHSHHGEGG